MPRNKLCIIPGKIKQCCKYSYMQTSKYNCIFTLTDLMTFAGFPSCMTNLSQYKLLTNLEPLELLLALRRGLRNGRMAVRRHHRGPMGLDCRAVVVGPTMDSWARCVPVPSTVLGHSGNLGKQRQLLHANSKPLVERNGNIWSKTIVTCNKQVFKTRDKCRASYLSELFNQRNFFIVLRKVGEIPCLY